MSKRRFGDRKDGTLLRDLDSMHFIMPLIYPNRCDNEAYISVPVELDAVNAYLEKKNGDDPVFRYTLFHVIVAAVLKVLVLRPKMNRFIANKNMYQRNNISASFVVKKQFSDSGGEALALLKADKADTMDSLHDKLFEQVSSCRSDKVDQSTDSMDFMNKLPRFLSKFLVYLVTKLDKHGLCPDVLIATDPYYASAILSNLGSIQLKSGYHHLTNWGTTSLFCIVGEKKFMPRFMPDGSYTMHETVTLGLTIDERLADGYYYAKSIRLLKKLLENPELLDAPLENEPEY